MHDSDIRPLVETINSRYFPSILGYYARTVTPVGGLIKVDGFNEYNFLIDINSVFSSHPKFYPIDRTNTVNHPVKWSNRNPWTVPTINLTLDEAMSGSVSRFEKFNKKINIFWSGGIDSTAIVTAFLKFAKNKSQIRIIYSPWSVYEHPEYLNFLKNYPEIELLDQSGEVYLDLNLDGIYISGNSGDEIHASIDASFLERYGVDILNRPWKDLFYQHQKNDKFIDFSTHYMSLSGFNINTVLEARWWFYTSCKIDSLLREQTVPFIVTNKRQTVSVTDIYGFFNCQEYEQFIYWNIPVIINGGKSQTWKQHLKDFCYSFDGLQDWWRNKTKFHSVQFLHYLQKKVVLNDQRYIFILDNNQLISTDNLPFLNHRDFDNKYGSSLNYLFNAPDKL